MRQGRQDKASNTIPRPVVTGTRNKGQGFARWWIPGSAVGRGAAVEFAYTLDNSKTDTYCLTLALVMNLEVLRERSNHCYCLGLLVLVWEF
jgi:hypothetical protein